MNFFTPNTSISDKDGNLLFYSNGCDIAGADDIILENGEDINPGFGHDFFCDEHPATNTYASGFQSMITLPQPETDGIYWMFHERSRVHPDFTGINDALLYTVVDMNENGGKGRVIEKNLPVVEDSIAFGELTAVKHGNGKDWWVVVPRRLSNTYYAFLLTKDGIVDTVVNTIGTKVGEQWESEIQDFFSPDGSVLLRTQMRRELAQLRYFDRNTGIFTHYKEFKINYDTTVFNNGCCISPSGQYAYIMIASRVYQFDLWADDISSTQTTVGWYDGFQDPIGITFGYGILGPDCKIYVLGQGDTKYFHVIHNPDEKGLACNLEMRGLVLPTPKGATMPFPPNYRLGPIDNPGVPCTPTVSINAASPLPQLSIFPNPATEQVTIKANKVLPKNSFWKLYDTNGRMVRDVPISHTGAAQAEVWLADLPRGLYFYETRSEGRVLKSGALVLER